MSKPIWIRLRSVLERDADATSVELSRESAEEMLAEIKRLTAENEKLAADLDGYIKAANDYMRENEKLSESVLCAALMLSERGLSLAEKCEMAYNYLSEIYAALSGNKHE